MNIGTDVVPESLPIQRAGQPAASPEMSERFVTVITPVRGWFDWRLGELWRFRDLIAAFVWRDFVSVYKQTILGPAWHLLKPILTTLTFVAVFSGMVGLSTDGAPPFLFYMIGNIAWTYFATCMDNTAKTFTANAWLMGKVYFHRMVIPVSLLISNLVAAGIQFAMLILAMLFYAVTGSPVHPTWWLLALPLFVVMLAGFALGAGLIICSITTRYRDLNFFITFGIQLLMYLTPVIYPLSGIPGGYRWAASLNPLTPVFEGLRVALLGVGELSVSALLVSAAVMVVMLFVGMALFVKAERSSMDTV